MLMQPLSISAFFNCFHICDFSTIIIQFFHIRYGPFWICSTLVFVAASIGTFITYIAHKLQNKEWNYDINLVTWSAGLFYGYSTIVPLCLFLVLKYFSAPSGLVQLLCLYGYSLFVFIPALVSLCNYGILHCTFGILLLD